MPKHGVDSCLVCCWSVVVQRGGDRKEQISLRKTKIVEVCKDPRNHLLMCSLKCRRFRGLFLWQGGPCTLA